MLLRLDGHHVSYLVPLISFDARFQAFLALMRAPYIVFFLLPQAEINSVLHVFAAAVPLVITAAGPNAKHTATSAANPNFFNILPSKVITISVRI